MSDPELLKKVRSNFQVFWNNLQSVVSNVELNPFDPLYPYQSNFLQTVIKLMSTVSLWTQAELLSLHDNERNQKLICVNVVLPEKSDFSSFRSFPDLESSREYYLFTDALVNYCKSQPPELTYICNLFTLLTVWQKVYEMVEMYEKHVDKTSILYKALPSAENFFTNIRLFLHVKCIASVFEVFMLLKNNLKNPMSIQYVHNQINSPAMMTAIASNDWDTVANINESILEHFTGM